MAIERTYTVPLRRDFARKPPYKRTNRAVKVLREFLARHMKAPLENIKLGQHVNEHLWANGLRNPPGKVKVAVTKDDEGIVRAELFGKEYAEAVQPTERTEQPQGLREKVQAAMKSPAKEEKPAKETPEEKPAQKAESKEEAPAKKAADTAE